MLTQEEIKRYAHMRRLKLSDQIWKDYLQDIFLYLLYRKMPKIVFSGGTCIWKVLKGDRFSEDIDIYAPSIPKDITDYLKKELALLGVNCAVLKKKKTPNMFFLKFALSFPSHPREILISVEILSDKPEKTEKATLHSPYPDIPPVEMIILSPEEMLANKVSAIYERNRPRDIHDIYLLLKRGTTINMRSVRKKEFHFNLSSFEKKLFEKEKTWKSLEPLLVTKLPTFEEEVKFILASFEREIN